MRDEPEEIALKLQQIEVLQGQRSSIGDAVCQIGLRQQTYQRWRKECGRMSRDQIKRLQQPETETENIRLRRAVSDLRLDKMTLPEAAPVRLLRRARRYRCIKHVRQSLGVSERRACRKSGQHRSTRRKVPIRSKISAKPNAGTRRAGTAFCERTTPCPAISGNRSTRSPITTTTADTTRACRTSPRSTITSDEARPF